MEFAAIVAEQIVGRLATYVSQELSFAWGAQLELTKLNDTLSTIKLVIKDAEKQQVRKPLITLWLRKLKDVCYDVDDVLDEMEYQNLQLEVESDNKNNNGKVQSKVRRFFSHWNPVLFNFKMGHKVKEIRRRLAEIDNEKTQFSLVEMSHLTEDPKQVHDVCRKITTSHVDPNSVIGRDVDKQQMMEYVWNDGDLDGNVSVISVIGLGGLGKTTLAKLVYNDSFVLKEFERRMWICVSDNFDHQTLVKGITSAAGGPKLENESLDIMETKLQDTIGGKKFLLVLDDVWDTELIGVTREKWITLTSLLNAGAIGSKIIITTRNKTVASLVNSRYKHYLEGLPHNECMSLFIQNAFNKGEEQRYPHLIKIGEVIVNKCGGVPLAVATLGSMLYLNREPDGWLSVRDDALWSIGNDNILPALKLSYDALPQHLKPCFAFCSLFPKDYEFDSYTLVARWVAHGYIKTSKSNKDLEKLGMDYVKLFCSRSLFQVEHDYKTRMIFKMHDLIHDVAILVAQAEYSTVNLRPSSAFEKVRHVSIFRNDLLKEAQVPDMMLRYTKLRTFLVFDYPCKINEPFMKTCISRFKYMRLLDLSRSGFEKLPSSVGNLFHLRFLSLSSNDKIRRLPNSIGKLLNLEFLNLYGCAALEEIPEDIGNLINLRSLAVTTQQKYLPKGIGRLSSLQIFYLHECVNVESLGKEIAFLTNICQLGISGCRNLKSLLPSMRPLNSLHTLFIFECGKLDLTKTIEGPQCLRSFRIQYSDIKVFPKFCNA